MMRRPILWRNGHDLWNEGDPITTVPRVEGFRQALWDHVLSCAEDRIVYGDFGFAFVYVGYIKSIPQELEEAAYVDGAGPWKVFWKVIFPFLAPMNATVGILTCLWAWNDFLLPLVILSDRESFTLPLVQYVFQSQFSTDYNLAFASYLMALSPMILVYLVAQKWIISGVTRGAVK